MALERQSIEKKDFPIGRRGYDPDAVDAHLARLADEIDHLKVTSRRRTETLASSASEQVRAIVEAAEQSAAEIQRQAEEEAYDIRSEASEEAQATRQQANTQARDYVGKVSESTAGMLQRLDAMESELSALIESLRTGANRLNADLQLLEGNLEEVTTSVEPRPRFVSEPEPPRPAPRSVARSAPAEPAPPSSRRTPERLPREPFVPDVNDELVDDDLEFDDAGVEETVDELTPMVDEAAVGGEDDAEGARLIALNMALNGTPREDTDRYLAENFALRNRAALLDEIYDAVAD